MKSGTPLNTRLSIDSLPFFGYELFTNFEIKILNYALGPNQYYRLRTQRFDGTYDMMISKTYNDTFYINFPKKTRIFYIDIVEDQRENSNDYTIYVSTPSLDEIQISEMRALS